MITRRQIMWGALAVVGVGAVGTLTLGRVGAQKEIVSILKRRLSYLKLDEAGLYAFAKDQVSAALNKKVPTWNRMKYHFLSAVAPSFKRFYRSSDKRSRIVKAEDGLIQQYLLSSDWLKTADVSLVVNYVAYYDPNIPCGNPFSRPVQST